MLYKGPYNAQKTEPEILDFWLKGKFFKPEYHPEKGLLSEEEMKTDGRKSFCIVNPPPNAYMRPHIGNVSGYAYQDVFLRYNRMKGKKVLGQPGKDHAGIQGEVMLEKIFMENKGKTKQEMGREKFYKSAYAHFEKLMPKVMSDEQRIGLSSDYDRNLFTLDPKVVKTVLGTFTKMFRDKMVYKGVRIVNWDPVAKTTLADIDTERVERESELVYIKYPLVEDRNEKALNFKKKFEGQMINWTYERNRTLDGKYDLPFYYGSFKDYEIDGKAVNVIGLGYSGELKEGDLLDGEVIGIQLNLTAPYRLVVMKKGADINFETKLREIYEFEKAYYAGAHIVLFEVSRDEDFQDGIIVATTRAETMLGDTAVVVHPEDERYKNLIGGRVILPLVNREIPIISSTRVDKEFGTGAVKLTPAHAYDDYVMANEWNAQIANDAEKIGYINVIDKEAKMTGPIPEKYKCMETEKAREAVIQDLETQGLIVKREPHMQNVMIGERSKAVIEQIMSSQWFIDVEKLKGPAIDAVKNGEVQIHPDFMKKKYFQWMENLHDWPVSRSLWWGYQIPVWYKGEVKEEVDQETGQIIETINGERIEGIYDAVEKGLTKVQIEDPNVNSGLETNTDSDTGKIFLVPGKHGYAQRKIFPEIQSIYTDAEQIQVKNIDNPSLEDYEKAFLKYKFGENDIIIAHSLGSRAIIRHLLDTNTKIKHLYLLAPVSRFNENELREKDLNSNYKDLITDISGYEKLESLVDKLYIIFSDNDEMMNADVFIKFVDLFKDVIFYEEQDTRHYAGEDYDIQSPTLLGLLEYNTKNSNSKKNEMNQEWIQDPDVFDTWFSSGQWPYATLTANNLMDTFFPTDIMETGYDILELWVSRMIMLSLYTQSKVPFKHVYLHGLVKAPDGQKMSKSKGNVIEPEKIITEYGADALRLQYIVGNKAGAGYPISYEKLEGYKRFLNKIWNASKFILNNTQDLDKNDLNQSKAPEVGNESDQKLLKELDGLKHDIERHIDNYRIGMAAELLYQHFWHYFCDLCLEEVKPRLYTKDKEGNPINQAEKEKTSRKEAQLTLLYALKQYMKLLHPFIPFITEAVWQEMKNDKQTGSIMYSQL